MDLIFKMLQDVVLLFKFQGCCSTRLTNLFQLCILFNSIKILFDSETLSTLNLGHGSKF